MRIYVNKIENTITVKIKTGYYLELLTPETMQLLGHTKSKITKDKNIPSLVDCNIFNNDNHHDLRVLYVFVSNKSFGQLLDILPKDLTLSEAFRIFINWSMGYWSKFWTARERRSNKNHYSY